MNVCPTCKTQTLEGQNFCSKCGSSLEATTNQLQSGIILENRYKIIEPLGFGGMGAVYLAQDLRLNESLVAIKEMKVKGLSNEELEVAIEAFRKEATMLINLRHSALPRVIDFFSVGDRSWYLVMDYIQGENLKSLVQRCGPISEGKVVDWAKEICHILKYLHSQEPPIIFRDIKPDNIMLMGSGEIKLIDFGIARHFKTGVSKDTTAYGSIGFAPPEQYGENQTDIRSDIYALGATLHYLLTGIDPGNKPFTFELPSKLVKVSNQLESLIMKALALKPEERHASAQEILDFLIGVESGNQVTKETLLISQDTSSECYKTDILKNPETKSRTDSNKANRKLYISIAVLSIIFIFILAGFYFLPTKDQPGQVAETKSEQPAEEPSQINQQEMNEHQNVSQSVIQLSDEASERLLREEELYTFSAWELTILRNAIYAWHGRPFITDEIRHFFEQEPWYWVNPSYSDSLLNKIESQNAAMILEYQKKSGKLKQQ